MLSLAGRQLVGPLSLFTTAGATFATRWCSSHNGFPRMANRMFIWGDILRAARSDPEKLHDIVDTLTKHCIAVQAAPPLDSFNDLLGICDAHADVSSIYKLCHMALATRMHLDGNTSGRLATLSQQYFPSSLPVKESSLSGSRSRGGISMTLPLQPADGSSSSTSRPSFSVSSSSGGSTINRTSSSSTTSSESSAGPVACSTNSNSGITSSNAAGNRGSTISGSSSSSSTEGLGSKTQIRGFVFGNRDSERRSLFPPNATYSVLTSTAAERGHHRLL